GGGGGGGAAGRGGGAGRRPARTPPDNRGVPAVEVVVPGGPPPPPAEPLQRRDHLAMPAGDVGENLPHPPAPQPDLPHLGLVEAHDRRPEPIVLVLGLLQQLLLGAHPASRPPPCESVRHP